MEAKSTIISFDSTRLFDQQLKQAGHSEAEILTLLQYMDHYRYLLLAYQEVENIFNLLPLHLEGYTFLWKEVCILLHDQYSRTHQGTCTTFFQV